MVEGQRERETDRQTDRQTEIETETEKDRDRGREKHTRGKGVRGGQADKQREGQAETEEEKNWRKNKLYFSRIKILARTNIVMNNYTCPCWATTQRTKQHFSIDNEHML